jgi:hypothetical protein
MLPESSSSQQTLAQQLPYMNDPYIIDIVKVTEDRVAELELELQQQKKYTDEIETNMANLKYQVKIKAFVFYNNNIFKDNNKYWVSFKFYQPYLVDTLCK